jgi:hypothetical protein
MEPGSTGFREDMIADKQRAQVSLGQDLPIRKISNKKIHPAILVLLSSIMK